MNAFLTTISSGLLPVLLQIIAAVLGVLLLRLSTIAKERWGIEIEARHREALQSALMTGIKSALSRGWSGEDALKAAVEHVIQRGAPDAVDYFGLSLGDLAEMAGAKLQDAITAPSNAVTADPS